MNQQHLTNLIDELRAFLVELRENNGIHAYYTRKLLILIATSQYQFKPKTSTMKLPDSSTCMWVVTSGTKFLGLFTNLSDIESTMLTTYGNWKAKPEKVHLDNYHVQWNIPDGTTIEASLEIINFSPTHL